MRDRAGRNGVVHIFGVVPALDVTAMDWRPRGSQWTRAKGTDTFKPVGPYLVTGVDYDNRPVALSFAAVAQYRTTSK